MREHLLSSLLLTCVVALFAGCQEKPEPVEPIPPATPIALNQFVRGWAKTPTLDSGDAVKELHPRENTVYAYTKSGQVISMSRETGDMQWIGQIRSTDRGGMRPRSKCIRQQRGQRNLAYAGTALLEKMPACLLV